MAKRKRNNGRDKNALTARQATFVEEYLVDGNTTQAAIRAGYAAGSAHTTGHNLLKHHKVRLAITRAQRARSERTQVTQDRVLLELTRIGLADIRKLVVWDQDSSAYIPSKDLTADEAAAISSIRTKSRTFIHKNGTKEICHTLELKCWNKNDALREIGKHLGVEDPVSVKWTDELSGMTDEQLAERAALLARRIQNRKGKKK
jgi:phage terminase small subunit